MTNLGASLNADRHLYRLHEYVRPWKVVTLLLGIGLLIVGAFYYEAPDWDVGISLIMGVLAYLAAPWSAHVLVDRRWRLLPVAFLATWVTVDGSYALYWYIKDPAALAAMRDANLLPSLMLYCLCALVWFYRGSLGEFWKELSAMRRQI